MADMDHQTINHANRLRLIARVIGRAALPQRWAKELLEAADEIDRLTSEDAMKGRRALISAPLHEADTAVHHADLSGLDPIYDYRRQCGPLTPLALNSDLPTEHDGIYVAE